MSPSLIYVEPITLKNELTNGHELALLDVREQGQYGEGHPFHAVPVAYSRLELDVGRLIPNLSASIVLLDDGCGDTVAARAAYRLYDIGYKNVRVLKNGADGWCAAGYTLFKGVHVPSKTFGELVEINAHTPRITPDFLKSMQERGDDFVVLDGRSRNEYTKMNIPGAFSCPNAELPYRLHRLAPDKKTTVVINCAGRTRSIIGAQSLINLGVDHPVFALENGTQGWFLKDFPLEHNSNRFYPPVSDSDAPLEAIRQRAIFWAQTCGVKSATAEQLQYWLGEASRTTYFFDIRTPEEFKFGSVFGAIHAEGGQLLQGTDLYIAVRHSRVVLYDTDGIRAPLVGSWLCQMGFEVFLLDAVKAQTVLGPRIDSKQSEYLPPLQVLSPEQLLELGTAVHIVDIRPSLNYRSEHLFGAVWCTRSRLRAHLATVSQGVDPVPQTLILVALDPQIAALAATELSDLQKLRTLCLISDSVTWKKAGLMTESTPNFPTNADCIDYLFFVHDRHEGNKQSARKYLEWEMNLVSQLDEQEKSSFRIIKPTYGSA